MIRLALSAHVLYAFSLAFAVKDSAEQCGTLTNTGPGSKQLVGSALRFACTAPAGSWRNVSFGFYNGRRQCLALSSEQVLPAPDNSRTAVLNYTSWQPFGAAVRCFYNGEPLDKKYFVYLESLEKAQPKVNCFFIKMHVIRCYFENFDHSPGRRTYGLISVAFTARALVESLNGTRHHRDLLVKDKTLADECSGCRGIEISFLGIPVVHTNVTLTLNNSVSSTQIHVNFLEYKIEFLRPDDFLLTQPSFTDKGGHIVMALQLGQELTCRINTSVAALPKYAEDLRRQGLFQWTSRPTSVTKVFERRLYSFQSQSLPMNSAAGHKFNVRISNTHPATDYKFRIQCKVILEKPHPSGEPRWSLPKQFSHISASSVPIASPRNSLEAFWLEPISQDARNVTLYWQPLPLLDWGRPSAESFQYEVLDASDNILKRVPATSTQLQLQIGATDTQLLVFARNKIGRSMNAATYYVARSAPAAPTARRTLKNNHIVLDWDSPAVEGVLNFTVHWCISQENGKEGQCSQATNLGDALQVGVMHSRVVEPEATSATLDLDLHRTYHVAISMQTTQGSSGLSWAVVDSQSRSPEHQSTLVLVSTISAAVLAIVVIFLAYRYSQHLKKTFCVKICRVPKPEVIRPPALQQFKGQETRAPSRYRMGPSFPGAAVVPPVLAEHSTNQDGALETDEGVQLLERSGPASITEHAAESPVLLDAPSPNGYVTVMLPPSEAGFGGEPPVEKVPLLRDSTISAPDSLSATGINKFVSSPNGYCQPSTNGEVQTQPSPYVTSPNTAGYCFVSDGGTKLSRGLSTEPRTTIAPPRFTAGYFQVGIDDSVGSSPNQDTLPSPFTSGYCHVGVDGVVRPASEAEDFSAFSQLGSPLSTAASTHSLDYNRLSDSPHELSEPSAAVDGSTYVQAAGMTQLTGDYVTEQQMTKT